MFKYLVLVAAVLAVANAGLLPLGPQIISQPLALGPQPIITKTNLGLVSPIIAPQPIIKAGLGVPLLATGPAIIKSPLGLGGW